MSLIFIIFIINPSSIHHQPIINPSSTHHQPIITRPTPPWTCPPSTISSIRSLPRAVLPSPRWRDTTCSTSVESRLLPTSCAHRARMLVILYRRCWLPIPRESLSLRSYLLMYVDECVGDLWPVHSHSSFIPHFVLPSVHSFPHHTNSIPFTLRLFTKQM